MLLDMTACLETFEKRGFAASRIDTARPQENHRDSRQVPRLPRKPAWQPTWKPSKRRDFVTSPKDTARPQENQRLETRHVGAEKRAFCARHPPIFILCSFKINVFLWVFLGTSKFAASKFIFRARLPSIFILSHKMPRLKTEFAPCRHLTRPWQCDSQKNATRHIWSAAPATQNDAGHVQSAAPATKTATHLWKTSREVLHLPHKTTFDTLQNTSECNEVPRLPRTRNEATRRFAKPSKMSPSGELTIGTAIRGSRERLRTVADGCERLGTVADGCGRKRNVERTHPQPPDPQSETGTLATHSGKKRHSSTTTYDSSSCHSRPDPKSSEDIWRNRWGFEFCSRNAVLQDLLWLPDTFSWTESKRSAISTEATALGSAKGSGGKLIPENDDGILAMSWKFLVFSLGQFLQMEHAHAAGASSTSRDPQNWSLWETYKKLWKSQFVNG